MYDDKLDDNDHNLSMGSSFEMEAVMGLRGKPLNLKDNDNYHDISNDDISLHIIDD